MADLSKQRIQTLTQAAGSSPTLNTGTQSLGGDLIQAAKFGVELYQKNQAQQEIADIQQQQSIFQSEVSKGVAGFETLQRNLEASQVSGTRANSQISNYLNKYDVETRNAILAGTKALTGTSALGSVSDAEAEIIAKQDATFELQSTAAQLIPYSTSPVPDLETMPDQELREYIVGAQANKARLDAKEAALQASAFKQKDKNGVIKKTAALKFNELAITGSIAQAKTLLGGVSLADDVARKDVMDQIRKMKQEAVLKYQRMMLDTHNIAVGATEAQEALMPTLSTLDGYMEDVLGTDAVKIGDNSLARLTNGALVAGYTKNPRDTMMFLLGKAIGYPIPGVAEDTLLSILEGVASGRNQSTDTVLENLEVELRSKNVPEAEIEKHLQTAKDMTFKASDSYKELTSDDKNTLTNSLMQDINPSTEAELVRSMHSGTITRRLEELANPESAQTYIKDAEEIGQSLERPVKLLLSTLGTKVRTGRTQSLSQAMSGSMESHSLSHFYDFNTSTNQFELKDPRVVPPANERDVLGTNVIRNVNSFIGTTLKAYKNLGLDTKSEELKQELNSIFGEQDASEGSN